MNRRSTYVPLVSPWERVRVERRRAHAARARREISTVLAWALVALMAVVLIYGAILGLIGLYDLGQLPTL
jgi:hypothetical protein